MSLSIWMTLIYLDGLPEHITHVWEVLHRLCVNGLFAHADKCEFHITSCEYLGYMPLLSHEGLTMASNKVQIIQDWPKPRKVKDIQSFLGFANFYCRFIYEYSQIAVPLTQLTRKGAIWHFTNECRSAFQTVKKAFTTAQSSPTGYQTHQSQLRLTPLTTHSQLYFPL